MAKTKRSRHVKHRKGVKPAPPKLRAERQLTAKQAAFAQEYQKDFNATQAAIRCGYAPRSAAETGCLLLKHPKIAAEVARLASVRAAALELDALRLDQEAGRLAIADIRRCVDEDGNPIPLHLLHEDIARALKGLEIQERRLTTGSDGPILIMHREYKYSFWDKNAAIVTLHRRHGRLMDKTAGSVAVSGSLELKAALIERYQRLSTGALRELDALEAQREAILRRELGGPEAVEVSSEPVPAAPAVPGAAS